MPYIERYDTEFSQIPGLAWMPWVGKSYIELPQEDRLLVVGESHDTKASSNEQANHDINLAANSPNWTRDTIIEGGLNNEWNVRNPTYEFIDRLFFVSGPTGREWFWSQICYANICQRLLWNIPNDHPQRPTDSDFESGWKALFKVIEVVRPAACLFFGLTAANHFDCAVHKCLGQEEKVKRFRIEKNWGRRASFLLQETRIPITFILHPCRNHSPVLWAQFVREACAPYRRMVRGQDCLTD